MTDFMDLKKLTQMREKNYRIDLPIGDIDICERYEKLYTGVINDVMRELCLVDQALPSEIHPLFDKKKIAGIAFTIKSSKDPTITGEMEIRANMLDAMHKNCIAVWDAGGETEAAHWGEIMTAASKQRGARGAVVDGGIRDTLRIIEQDFPVFYKYRISNGSLALSKIISYQVPIKIGKVIIYPGDIVFGDIDGVLVVPREIAYKVLQRAEKMKKSEKDIRKWIESGTSAGAVVEKGGYF